MERKSSNSLLRLFAAEITACCGLSEQPVNFWRVVIKTMQNRRFSTVDRRNTGISPAFPASRAHLAQQGQQSFACQPQIGQCKQRHDLPGVLLESAVANLGESELALHDAEGMLDDGPYCREHPVEGFLFNGQFAAGRLLGRGQYGKVTFLLEVLDGPVCLVIATITQSNFLFSVQASIIVMSATFAVVHSTV